MYLKDKSVKVSVRISDDQLSFLHRLSGLYGLSVSEVLRAILDSYRGGFNYEDE